MHNYRNFRNYDNDPSDSDNNFDFEDHFENFEEEPINKFEYIKQKIHNLITPDNYDNIKFISICIAAITIICTLCFPNTFFKLLLILETIVAISSYMIYKFKGNKDGILAINQLEDGIEIIHPYTTKLSLNDIIIREPVEELSELLSFVQNPDIFESTGYTPENRILLLGETGFGKEALIKAFAHDSNLIIARIHASRFLENEEIFDTLSTLADNFNSFVLQIDAFETIFAASSTSEGENSEVIVDKLKVYLSCYNNIICFANCEEPSAIENIQSVERLFKKAIIFNIPDHHERIKFLKEFTKDFDLDENVDFENISKNCFGFSIGEIKYLVTTAVGIAHKNNRKKIVQSDFFAAFDSIEYGISNKKHSKESQKVVAYHEAGHGLPFRNLHFHSSFRYCNMAGRNKKS